MPQAGAGVGPGKETMRTRPVRALAAVLQDLQPWGGKGDLNGVVLPDVAVGRLLQLLNLLPG